MIDSFEPLLFVDSHVHLTMEPFDPDREQVLENARKAGVLSMIHIGLGPDPISLEKTWMMAMSNKDHYAAMGIHPHQSDSIHSETLRILKEFLTREKVVGLGEIGLDYFHSSVAKEIQRAKFEQLIELGLELSQPLIIHSRDSFQDVYEMIKHYGVCEKLGVVFHCFTGNVLQARKLLDLGAYLSFAGIVTFNKAIELQEVVRWMPLSHMFIETDCPYLAPDPHRGKRNEPAFVVNVAQKIADCKKVSVREVAETTFENFKKIFLRSAIPTSKP